jgi:hypothetical protein
MLRLFALFVLLVASSHAYRFELDTDTVCAAENSQGFCTHWKHTGDITPTEKKNETKTY